MVDEDIRQQIEFDARLDERDEVAAYLRALARFTYENAQHLRWFKRSYALAGAKALELAADLVAQRHRRKDA